MMDFEEQKKIEGMDEFEVALTRALARVEVRADLTRKFYALAEEVETSRRAAGGGMRLVKLSSGGRVIAMPKPKVWWGGAVAAMLVIGMFAGERVHEERKREAAEAQFDAAMRVTDHALEQTREQLERAGLRLQ